MTYTINFSKLAKEYGRVYRFLYDNDETIDYKKVVESFDIMIEKNDNFKRFIGEFCDYIQDIVSSDRECAALILAMSNLHYI